MLDMKDEHLALRYYIDGFQVRKNLYYADLKVQNSFRQLRYLPVDKNNAIVRFKDLNSRTKFIDAKWHAVV